MPRSPRRALGALGAVLLLWAALALSSGAGSATAAKPAGDRSTSRALHSGATSAARRGGRRNGRHRRPGHNVKGKGKGKGRDRPRGGNEDPAAEDNGASTEDPGGRTDEDPGGSTGQDPGAEAPGSGQAPRPTTARPSVTPPAAPPQASPVTSLPVRRVASIPILVFPRDQGSTAPTRRRRERTSGRRRRSSTGGAIADAAARSPAAVSPPSPSGRAGRTGRSRSRRPPHEDPARTGSPVTRTVRDIVEVVPDSLKMALAALAALSLLLGGAYLLSALRNRRLGRQRGELLQEVGLLQGALLPSVPERLGAVRASVAYRPADGPAAGGDFYDALPLPGGRTGFIMGDVSGHGRDALAHTAFMRYTLRAYLEAGLEPRVALQVAGRVVDGHLGGDFATVLLAVHDPASGSLTFASAGHPAPVVVGPSSFQPVLAASSLPLGMGERTGLRQTSLPLAPGSTVCLFTDGVVEARTREGLLGTDRLRSLLEDLGPGATARELLDRVADEARSVPDDMAACLISPADEVTAGGFRSEQLELSSEEVEGPLAARFLEACGVDPQAARRAREEAGQVAGAFGGAVLHVVMGNRTRVEVLPRNLEGIEAASRQVAVA